MAHAKPGFLGAVTLFLCAWLLLNTAHSRSDELPPQAFDIRPQNLAAALSEFARQSHQQILFAPELVATKNSGGVRGTMAPLAALTILLKDTGLPFSNTPNGAILIGSASNSNASEPVHQKADSPSQEERRDSSGKFRLAQVGEGGNPQAYPLSNNPASSDYESRKGELAEIIVTAQKRTERLQDVPVPVTSISAEKLVESNQFRLEDYYSSVPGLNLSTNGVGGAAVVAIRGVTTGGGSVVNPTVGILVDDVPFGSSTGLGGGNSYPDIDPSDLARVEVLRGPQGTLYGTSSLGGLIKFVTADPSTDGFSGRVASDVSTTYNADGPGYGGRAAVNVPISETLAVRASGYARRDSGYVDNPVYGLRGVNWDNAAGMLASALWSPSDVFSLKLGALLQNTTARGLAYVSIAPGLGDLQQNTLPGAGQVDRDYKVFSAVVRAKLGGVDLTSISGYAINSLFDTYDYTQVYGSFLTPYFGGAGTIQYEHNKTEKPTQEIRLSGHAGTLIDWLVGGVYTHENTSYIQDLESADSSTGAILGSAVQFNFPTLYTEYAAFTDLTVHFTDRFDVQIGGRESHITQRYNETDSGPAIPSFYGTPSPYIFPQTDTSDNAFTYLLTPRFRLSSDLMLYARIASGYRAGGPNPSAAAFGLPLSFSPDKTKNYEIGVKASIPNFPLSVDASIYRIDWQDIQLTAATPNGLGYISMAVVPRAKGSSLRSSQSPFMG